MMLNYRLKSIPLLALLLSMTVFLSACIGAGSSTKINYYLVDPVHVDNMEVDGSRQLAIEILDLHIPQYLQRFQLVSRDGDNRIHLSETNQWAENLRKNLLRTLAINLATRLSTLDIGTPLNRSSTAPDYRLHVHIGKFERDANGRVQLSARWQIADANEKDLGMHDANLV